MTSSHFTHGLYPQEYEKEEWAREAPYLIFMLFQKVQFNTFVKIKWADLSFHTYTCLNTNTDPASTLFLFSFALPTSHSAKNLYVKVSFAM